jgi:hypothetical protein
MKRLNYYILVVLLMLHLSILVGCVSSGNPKVMDQARLAQIVIDVSTKEDVKRVLGQPNSESQRSDSYATVPGSPPVPGLTNAETWSYTHLSVDVDGATLIPIVGLFAGGATSHRNTFTVVFDQGGVVRHISSTQSQGSSGPGAENDPSTYWTKKPATGHQGAGPTALDKSSESLINDLTPATSRSPRK